MTIELIFCKKPLVRNCNFLFPSFENCSVKFLWHNCAIGIERIKDNNLIRLRLSLSFNSKLNMESNNEKLHVSISIDRKARTGNDVVSLRKDHFILQTARSTFDPLQRKTHNQISLTHLKI